MMQCEKAAYQDLRELAVFIKLIQSEKVRNYLEIGSAHGGSLWRIGSALPEGSQITSIDLPFKNGAGANLEECCEALRRKGYIVNLIVGDSADSKIIEKAFQFAPYDLCFIDGNHTEKYVRGDWATYGSMARIVAFHDIVYHKTTKTKMYVPRFWTEIKRNYRHQEIKFCAKLENGIGVIWR